MLQFVAVCCSVLQCRTVCKDRLLSLFLLQGGENTQDALICRSLSAKEPLITLLQEMTLKDKAHGIQSSACSALARFRFRFSMCSVSCRCRSAKEPLIIGLFCGKRPIKIRRTRIRAQLSQPFRVSALPCNLLAPPCPVCVLQCVAVNCSELKCSPCDLLAPPCPVRVLQYVAVRYSALQRVAARCSALQ